MEQEQLKEQIPMIFEEAPSVMSHTSDISFLALIIKFAIYAAGLIFDTRASFSHRYISSYVQTVQLKAK